MNEHSISQSEFDYRTGRATFIRPRNLSTGEWKACVELNRQRARGIQEALGEFAPSGSIPPDEWLASLAKRASYLDVPLINLDGLGFVEDDVNCMSSRFLGNIGIGREASAWVDRDNGCVYKLFDVKVDREDRGSIGLKLKLETESLDRVEVVQVPARLNDILQKICVLHEAGACPTELVGLTDDGRYLVAKQPRCRNYESLEEDTRTAVKAVNAVSPKGSYGGNEIWVIFVDNKFWLLSDLHKGNIRRLPDGTPTIIDALIGELLLSDLKLHPKLAEAAERSRALATGAAILPDDPFHNVSDDDL